MKMILLPLLAPLFLFIVHVILSRSVFLIFPPRSLQKAVIILCILISLLFAAIPKFGWSTLYVGLSSLCFCYAYFHFFNMSETARRIKILISTLKKDKITYDGHSIVEQRIQRLIAAGTCIEENKKIVLKKGIMLFAAIAIDTWRRFLRIR